MSKSIKVNYAFNLLNTLVGLVFPIITFPYISRILMADGIGKVNFLYSIINYISLFTSIGIPIYAVREIAQVRDNIEKRNQTTVEILILHSILTIIGYIFVFLVAFSVNKIYQDLWLFLLLSLHLVLSTIGVIWFYQAVEDFKFIAIRSLLIRIIVLISLFVFVRHKNDLFAYAWIVLLTEVGNYIVNFIHLRSYVKLSSINWKTINIKRHIKPSLRIFLLNLITSIYVNLDSVMLGFLSTDAAVGFYTASVRVTKAILGLVSAMGTVLLPRLSNYVSTGAVSEFSRVTCKASDIIITVGIPMSVGLAFVAPEFMPVFCGTNYEPSILTIQILSPIIIFIGLSNLIGIQVLYSQGKESVVIKSTFIGACINLFLNFIFIPAYAQYGAALSSSIAEFSVITVMLYLGRQYIPCRILSWHNIKILCVSFLSCIPILYIRNIDLSTPILLLLEIFAAIIFYTLYLVLSKNTIFEMMKPIIKSKIGI